MAEHILVVEDDDIMRDSLVLELQSAGYRVTAAANGFEAIECARSNHFDLVVCDVRMPGMNGLQALSTIRQSQPLTRSIVVTGYASAEAPVTALKMQVDDYLRKPFSSQEFLDSVHRSLARYRETALTQGAPRFRESLMRLLRGVFFESHFPHLVGHSERVAGLALRLARRLGFSPQRSSSLYLAAMLHDIGQVELPAWLLDKREWEADEHEIFRSHPQRAADLLRPFADLGEVVTFIQHHHEKWDGGGYPRGLRGEQIPLESRILSLVETYDSLTNDRPHRLRKRPQDALAVLRREAGRSFDPALVPLFVELCTDESEEPPLPPALEADGGAPSLVALAETYRQLGNLEVAHQAFVEAKQSPRTPEWYFRGERGRVDVLMRQGRHAEALREAEALQQEASAQSLDFVAAQFALARTLCLLRLGRADGVAALLDFAAQTSEVWEAAWELALDRLLRACASRPDAPAFAAAHRDFIDHLRGSGLYDVLLEVKDVACLVFETALARGVETAAAAELFGSGPPALLTLLERLMDSEDRGVRLKVLDLLAASPHSGARALLARLQVDADAAVAQKSLLLRAGVAPQTEPLLQAFYFGHFRVSVGDQALPDEVWQTRKIRSLFAFMACRRGEVVSEDRLIEQFWSQGGDKARHSLHNSISQIRKALTPYLGAAAKRVITKKPDGYVFGAQLKCWSDVEEFNDHFSHGKYLADQQRWDEALVELQKAERIYQGDFLERSYEDLRFDAGEVAALARARVIAKGS